MVFVICYLFPMRKRRQKDPWRIATCDYVGLPLAELGTDVRFGGAEQQRVLM